LYSWFLAEKETVDSWDESSEDRTTVQTNRALGNPRVIVEDGQNKLLPKNVVKKAGQKIKVSTGSTQKPSEKTPIGFFRHCCCQLAYDGCIYILFFILMK
jgi:hypothetical protein